MNWQFIAGLILGITLALLFAHKELTSMQVKFGEAIVSIQASNRP